MSISRSRHAFRRSHLPRTLVPLLLAAFVGCDGGPTQPSPGEGPGTDRIRFVAGEGVTDTIEAELSQALVVEVTGEQGQPATGEVVRFESVQVDNSVQFPPPSMWVSGLSESRFSTLVVDTTDSDGRAAVRVQMGLLAGRGEIALEVPVFDLQDTARYRVEPGVPAMVAVQPADTMVTIGGSYALRTFTTDRIGNVREGEAPDSEAVSPEVNVDGDTVRGESFGRARVVARFDSLADTSAVSVVPSGTIAAAQDDGVDLETGIVVAATDGSGLQEVVTDPEVFDFVAPDWSPDGDRLVVHERSQTQLTRYDISGTGEFLLSSAEPSSSAFGQYSADGRWIYFQGPSDSGDEVVWRARTDGSALEQVTPDTADFTAEDSQPSPEPGGTRIVFRSNRGEGSFSSTLQVFDMSTGDRTSLGTSGVVPRWSPVDDRIAFLRAGAVWTVRPDGSELTRLTPDGSVGDEGLDWSPDGQWMVATSPSRFDVLTVLQVSSGEIVTLSVLDAHVWPTWRP